MAMLITSTDTHIWHAKLDQPLWIVQALQKFLSPDEQERAKRFVFDEHRARFIVGRGILRLLLADYLDCKPPQVEFSYSKYEKPELLHKETGLQFNLSHSEDQALFAFTVGRKVGIDIEHIRPMRDMLQVAAHFFSPYEQSVLFSLPPDQQTSAFFNCWTRKESFIKAIGNGLSFPLDQFDVSLAEVAQLLRIKDDRTVRWSMKALDLVPGYAATVTVEGETALCCYNLTIDSTSEQNLTIIRESHSVE
jgi:4'-phosphopantetheinyl transferase